MIVDYAYYATTYYGQEASADDFVYLSARAEDVIASLTKWAVTEDTLAGFPTITQTLYKKAVCAQIDYFSINGTDSANSGGSVGFTVGKVSVNNGASAANADGRKLFAAVSPLAIQYLEQSGLMSVQVQTAPDIPAWGWWSC